MAQQQSPASHVESSSRASLWAGLAILMFLLALAVAFGGRYLYQEYRLHRTRMVVAEATRLLEDQRWEAAAQILRGAFRTYGHDPDILRAVARLFMEGYDDPVVAAVMLRQVVAGGHGTPVDSIHLAESLLKQGDVQAARDLYEPLPAPLKNGRSGLELLSGIQRRAGEPDKADATLRQALLLEPDDPRAQLRLAFLDEASAFEISRGVAAQAIWNVAGRNDSAALEAIAHLADSPALAFEQARELLRLVRQHPKAAERDYFRVLSAYIRARPLEKEKVVTEEIKKHRGRPVEGMFDFLRWLGVQKQAEHILDLLPAGAAMHDPDVFLVYVDAMSEAGRWQDLDALMLTQNLPVTEATRHFVMADAALHLRPASTDAWVHIEKVFALALPNEQHMVLRAAALADQKGLNSLALAGYRRVAATRPDLQVTLFEKILAVQARDREASALLSTLKTLHELRPANTAYLDRLNYLRLVAGEETELAVQSVLGFEEESHPLAGATVPLGLMRALAAYRMGNVASIPDELKPVADPALMAAGYRAVFAGLQALAGNDVAAYRLAERVPQGLLLAEELRFWRRARE